VTYVQEDRHNLKFKKTLWLQASDSTFLQKESPSYVFDDLASSVIYPWTLNTFKSDHKNCTRMIWVILESVFRSWLQRPSQPLGGTSSGELSAKVVNSLLCRFTWCQLVEHYFFFLRDFVFVMSIFRNDSSWYINGVPYSGWDVYRLETEVVECAAISFVD